MRHLINTLLDIQELGASLLLTTSHKVLLFEVHYDPKEKTKFGFHKQATIDLSNEHAKIICADIDTELKICFQKAKDEHQQIIMEFPNK